MPDKEMSAEDFEVLKYRIEVLIEELAHAQKIYHGQTGRNYMPPLRLAPRKRRGSLDDPILNEEGWGSSLGEQIKKEADDA